MFKWLLNIFQKKPLYYSVFAKGTLVYKTSTYEDAEKFIRNSFYDGESKRKLNTGNTTRETRWKSYRSYFRIVKI
jgi:hypothetical protein